MRLPYFWQFLSPGWWLIHFLGIAIVYMLGVGHGRRQALRQLEEAQKRRNADPGAPREPRS